MVTVSGTGGYSLMEETKGGAAASSSSSRSSTAAIGVTEDGLSVDVEVVPRWVFADRVSQDLAQAWSVLDAARQGMLAAASGGGAQDSAQAAAELAELTAEIDSLMERMGPAEKRAWLRRRLQQYHHKSSSPSSSAPAEFGTAEDEEAFNFVECDRYGNILDQLREQLHSGTGLNCHVCGQCEDNLLVSLLPRASSISWLSQEKTALL